MHCEIRTSDSAIESVVATACSYLVRKDSTDITFWPGGSPGITVSPDPSNVLALTIVSARGKLHRHDISGDVSCPAQAKSSAH